MILPLRTDGVGQIRTNWHASSSLAATVKRALGIPPVMCKRRGTYSIGSSGNPLGSPRQARLLEGDQEDKAGENRGRGRPELSLNRRSLERSENSEDDGPMGLHKHSESESYADTVLRRVNWSADLDTVRKLFQDYRQWLADHQADPSASGVIVPAGLVRIDQEIADLPGVYGAPSGDIILAFRRKALVACGALRELEPKVGEIKRIYVRADHRGKGFGPRLTGALLDRARELGYKRVRVDTLPTMTAAIQFYQEMGFKPIPPYRPHPVPNALFFEYKL